LSKRDTVKGIILLVIAAVFLIVLFYSWGDIRSFFSMIIVLVCGGLGILYLMEGRKRPARKSKK
jgi:formate hydrogenlyase subunit 3/multisubunit Na+/H+ antiporter MnhD subunit